MAFDGLDENAARSWASPHDRSIARGVAKVLHEAGAELAFTYQGDVFKRVTPLVEPLNPPPRFRLRCFRPA